MESVRKVGIFAEHFLWARDAVKLHFLLGWLESALRRVRDAEDSTPEAVAASAAARVAGGKGFPR